MVSTIIAAIIGCLLGVICCGCVVCFAACVAYGLFWDYELHILLHPSVTPAKLRAARHNYLRSNVDVAVAKSGRPETAEMFEDIGREFCRVRAAQVQIWEDALLARPIV